MVSPFRKRRKKILRDKRMKRPQPETIFNNSDYEWISHDIQVQDPSKEYVDAILFRGITEKNLGRIVIWYERFYVRSCKHHNNNNNIEQV